MPILLDMPEAKSNVFGTKRWQKILLRTLLIPITLCFLLGSAGLLIQELPKLPYSHKSENSVFTVSLLSITESLYFICAAIFFILLAILTGIISIRGRLSNTLTEKQRSRRIYLSAFAVLGIGVAIGIAAFIVRYA